MTRIALKFTASELELLSSLASDQLFRREFIDSRMPGYKSNPAEVNLGKQLVQRLRFVADGAARTAPTRKNGAAVARKVRTGLAPETHDAV